MQFRFREQETPRRRHRHNVALAHSDALETTSERLTALTPSSRSRAAGEMHPAFIGLDRRPAPTSQPLTSWVSGGAISLRQMTCPTPR